MKRNLLTVVLALFITTTAVAADEAWVVDFEAAKAAAAKEGKDLFLEFTGSDWCPPCKALKAKVFDQDVFKSEAPKNFILVKLDYPRDKSNQTEAEIAQNKVLQKSYQIRGYPTVILADAAGRPFAQTVGFGGGTAEDYVKKLAEYRKIRETRDAALAEAAKADGVEKAKLIDKALSGIDTDLVASVYKEEAEKIISLDADGKAELKTKYEALMMVPKMNKALEQVQQKGGEPAERVKAIDEVIAEMKATGPALQLAHFAKALAMYGTDKPAAKVHLEAAIAAAPTTRKADEIRGIIKRVFGDTDAKAKSE